MTASLDPLSGRPILRAWRRVLRQPELRALHRNVCASAWIFDALNDPLVIGSGRINLPRYRSLRPLEPFAEAGGFHGVACVDAQIHSDEHITDYRWNIMGLIRCPGGRARVCAALDDGRVEANAIDEGDVFVLDVRRAHAAHAVDRTMVHLMTWWSVLLPRVDSRADAEELADKLVRWIGEARR